MAPRFLVWSFAEHRRQNKFGKELEFVNTFNLKVPVEYPCVCPVGS